MIALMVNRRARSAEPRPRRTSVEPTDKDHELLLQALADAEGLLPVLGRLLPEPVSAGPATGTIGRSAPESSEPWHSEAADAYWRIWFGARKLADRLCVAGGVRARTWGSASEAMSMIAKLASTVPPDHLAAARQEAEHWVTAARRIRDIDEVETWTPLPRPPGYPPPACPYCHTLSLRMARGREEVRCFFPECRDFDGRPTRARMELGRFSSSGHLVFGDGTVVAYREGHDAP
jgi:hypothetical protein